MGTEIRSPHFAEPLQPYSIEAEQIVLGNMLLHGGACALIARHGGAELFADPVHARIFEVAAERERQGLPVSPVTMAAVLEAEEGLRQLGGRAYLVRLAGAAVADPRGHLELLVELRAKRRIPAAIDDARQRIATGQHSAIDIVRALGSRLIDVQSQKMTAAANAMADRKTFGHRS